MTRIMPAQLFPPGDFIREELDARGWTETELARIADCELTELNDIMSGKQPISADVAGRLGEAFGTSALFWLNLDSAYRITGRRQDVTQATGSQ